MKKAGVKNIELYLLKEHIHNFLQYDDPRLGVPEYQHTAQQLTCQQFAKLFI
jgi:hypothetical protein